MTQYADTFPSNTFSHNRQELSEKAMERISVSGNSFPTRSGFTAVDSVIMMVDDEILNIEMTQAFLEDAGYTRFVCTTESENAVELMRREQPDVLLLDLSMPRVGGMQILAVLHKDEELRHIPVLVLTRNADGPTKLQALGLGAMDFLAKPVDPSELALRLRNTLAAASHRRYLLSHDALTELPNRHSYLFDVDTAIQSAGSLGHRCVLLHIGIDRLSELNNAMGRTVGDLLLQRMTKRLRECVKSAQGEELGSRETQNPRLYRLDGDKFAVLVPFLDEIESAAGLINSLLEAVATRLKIDNSEVLITASIGVAAFPIDGETSADLTKCASLAMKQARETGNTYEFFTPKLKERAVRALLVGGNIRRGLAHNEISVLYKPKIDVRTGRAMGAEAVPSWSQAGLPVVEGSQLFRLAGSSDMAVTFAEWLLGEISNQTSQWQSTGLLVPSIAVKFSLRQFPPAQLMELLSVAIIRGAKAKSLCLELSGIAGVSDPSSVARMINKLREWGFRIALDTFGTAEASLSDVNGLSIDEIKMAPSFTYGIENSPQNAAVVRSMLLLARELGCAFVVQDVETTQQLTFLKQVNADQCQGKLFGDPLPPKEFASKWLTVSG